MDVVVTFVNRISNGELVEELQELGLFCFPNLFVQSDVCHCDLYMLGVYVNVELPNLYCTKYCEKRKE